MINLDAIPTLSFGGHHRGEGACLMEAVAMLAGEPWGDHPVCASEVLGSYGRALNDAILPRQSGDARPFDRPDLEPRLRALAPRLINTIDCSAVDQRAGLLAMDWLIRTYTPTWLRLAGLTTEADELAALPEIVSWERLPLGALERAQRAAAAARAAADAARDAAGDAAWAAADAARAARAARDAAGAAAWDAARDAAWAAADAARDAAGDAAWAAADAARDAAGDAAGDAAWAAADAARDAAGDALRPTVTALQDSAVERFEAMVALYHAAPVPQ